MGWLGEYFTLPGEKPWIQTFWRVFCVASVLTTVLFTGLWLRGEVSIEVAIACWAAGASVLSWPKYAVGRKKR